MKQRRGTLLRRRSSDSQELPTHSSSGSLDGMVSPKRRRSRSRVGILALVAGLLLLLRYLCRQGSTSTPYYIPRRIEPPSVIPPLVHVVNTRFMQEQAHLPALSEARYRLFTEFCLPTMLQQSSQSFVWIIKVDPDIEPNLLRRLVRDVSSRSSNIYLVASRRNFRTHPKYPGAWRDGAALDDLYQSKVFSGDRDALEASMATSARTLILETRLDADDGLHVDYMKDIQDDAMKMWNNSVSNPPQWMYWCARRNLEWHWVPPKDQAPDGMLTPVVHQKLCVTPGITTAFPVGTLEEQVPILPHDKLAKDISQHQCQSDDPEAMCLQFVERYTFEAVRSRTPTSTGMLEVVLSGSELERADKTQNLLRETLYDDFGISHERLADLNSYLTEHLVAIAKDNLHGQCKTGHSCKKSAKKALKELIGANLDDSEE